MVSLIAGIVMLALVYMGLNVIRSADPKLLARLVRRIGGVLALAFAAWIGARGELVVAIPLGLFGLGCWATRRSARSSPRSSAGAARRYAQTGSKPRYDPSL